jgi:hypothetical protein
MSNEIVERFKKLIGTGLLGHPVYYTGRHFRNELKQNRTI